MPLCPATLSCTPHTRAEGRAFTWNNAENISSKASASLGSVHMSAYSKECCTAAFTASTATNGSVDKGGGAKAVLLLRERPGMLLPERPPAAGPPAVAAVESIAAAPHSVFRVV